MKTKILFLALILLTSSAFADRWNVDNGGIFSKGTGAVIEGYDPVSYFTENKAVKGSPKHASELEGGVFYFSSDKNKKLFDANPSKYMPEYGGYCAYGAAKGSLVDIDPTAFTIINEKLYLNYSASIKSKFDQSQVEYITEADKNWPKLKSE